MTAAARHTLAVRVITALGVEHLEGHTNIRQKAEDYARLAVEDHCQQATVLRINGGMELSVWNPDRVRRWKANRGLTWSG